MDIPEDLLELLQLQNPAALAQESGGRFPLAELDDALRTGQASADLVTWLELWRERRLGDEADELQAAAALGTRPASATGSRMDSPPLGDAKNYEQGPA